MRNELQKQISEIEMLMQSIIANDPENLNTVLNEVTLGVYDFPLAGTDLEKVLFMSQKLKQFNIADLLKYSKMMHYQLDKQCAITIIENLITNKKLRTMNRNNQMVYVVN